MDDIFDYKPLLRHQYETDGITEISYEEFERYISVLKSLPNDLQAICAVVSGLQKFIFSANEYLYDSVSREDLILSKTYSAFCIMKAIHGFINEELLYPIFLSVFAQCYFSVGDWKEAIIRYEELLKHPSILKVEVDTEYYTGELSAAAHIIHNLCVLYTLDNDKEKANILKSKYKYVFDLEEQQAKRIAFRALDEGNQRLAVYVKEEFNKLLFDMNTFYLENSLLMYIPEILKAIHSDCKVKNEYAKLNFDEELTISVVESIVHLFDTGNDYIMSIIPWELRMQNTDSTQKNTNEDDIPFMQNDAIGRHSEGEDKGKTDTSPLSPMDELNSLIGLATIKQDVQNMFNLVKMQKLRHSRGMKTIPLSLHLVFTGNPGTGKTTIARILGRLYQEIGVLKTGQLIEVDRSDLVAGYVGQTAIKTQKKIQEAMGGILFIDEAYTLSKDSNDFGQEAVDTLLKAMEDYRDSFIVIVAGYEQPMQTFINSNPGLKSRFNKYFHFPDYSYSELVEIFSSLCTKYDYRITTSAFERIKKIIYEMESKKECNFANAREIRNLFERIVTNQSSRIAISGYQDDEDIFTITEDDI